MTARRPIPRAAALKAARRLIGKGQVDDDALRRLIALLERARPAVEVACLLVLFVGLPLFALVVLP